MGYTEDNFVDPRTGKRYKAKFIVQGSPEDRQFFRCDLCDLKTNCDEEMCHLWRECATINFSSINRTYFKELP